MVHLPMTGLSPAIRKSPQNSQKITSIKIGNGGENRVWLEVGEAKLAQIVFLPCPEHRTSAIDAFVGANQWDTGHPLSDLWKSQHPSADRLALSQRDR